jgi:hypothetical protein
MKKVLIALDYDPTAQKVAESGYALAAMGAEVVLLHVLSDPVYSSQYSPVGDLPDMDIGPQLDSVESHKGLSTLFIVRTPGRR